MKSNHISFFLFICFVAFHAISCNSGGNPTTENKNVAASEVSVADFDQKINSNTASQVVDVRTPEEYETGHLNQALNIDWRNPNFETTIATLDKTKPTFVYCQSGKRSSDAAAKMRSMGFTEVYEMQGGISAWNKAGKAVVMTVENAPSKNMTMDAYKKQIASEKLVLVDFNAPWCGPCKRMAPLLEEISNEQKDFLELVKINSDDNPDLTATLNVENLPTLILYKGGKEVWKHVGYLDKIGVMIAIESAKK